MDQKRILLKVLNIMGASIVLGTPLAAMEPILDKQERKNISKQISAEADNLIHQWKSQGSKRVILAGHNIDPKQEQYISPLVEKIAFKGLKTTQNMQGINCSNVAAYIMGQIAANSMDYNRDGLMLISPAPKDGVRVRTFDGSSSAEDAPIIGEDRFGNERITYTYPSESKISFSTETETELNKIAEVISNKIIEKNSFELEKFTVAREDLPPTLDPNKTLQVPKRDSPLKARKSKETTKVENFTINDLLNKSNCLYFENWYGAGNL